MTNIHLKNAQIDGSDIRRDKFFKKCKKKIKPVLKKYGFNFNKDQINLLANSTVDYYYKKPFVIEPKKKALKKQIKRDLRHVENAIDKFQKALSDIDSNPFLQANFRETYSKLLKLNSLREKRHSLNAVFPNHFKIMQILAEIDSVEAMHSFLVQLNFIHETAVLTHPDWKSFKNFNAEAKAENMFCEYYENTRKILDTSDRYKNKSSTKKAKALQKILECGDVHYSQKYIKNIISKLSDIGPNPTLKKKLNGNQFAC